MNGALVTRSKSKAGTAEQKITIRCSSKICTMFHFFLHEKGGFGHNFHCGSCFHFKTAQMFETMPSF